MNKRMAVYVFAYGVLLAGLGLLAHWANPEANKVVLITGGVSGALCVFWGVLGLLGHRGRLWTGLTLAATILVLVQQTVHGWLSSGAAQSASHLGALVMTVMLLTSLGIMMYVMHCGECGECAPGSAAGAKAP